MKILMAHNYYQSSAPSGEDAVFNMERELLTRAGHDVVTYTRHNDEINGSSLAKLGVALGTPWSKQSYREIGRLVAEHKPDVAHFHNTSPLITPSAYRACQNAGVPVVQTLHNYRLVCPGALLMRNGRPCEQCVGKAALAGIFHGCYRGSMGATAVIASATAYHHAAGTYSRDVNRFIALTDFARERFIRGGIPAERIVVRPNFLTESPLPGKGGGGYALYVGRLTAEKGVRTLLRAWIEMDIPLKIAGDGALRGELELISKLSPARIEFLGLRPRAEVWELMKSAELLVFPSEWYEGFPVTILEAFATGAPIVASKLGVLDELVIDQQNGLKFSPRDAHELNSAVKTLVSERTALNTIRTNNRARFEQEFSTSRAMDSLMLIYKSLTDAQSDQKNHSAGIVASTHRPRPPSITERTP